MNDRLVEWGYGAAWRAVRMLPEPVAARLFRMAADRVHAKGGKGVRQLRANLARVVPDAGPAELDALTRAGMRSYCRYWLEAFRLPSYSREELLNRFHLDGTEAFDEARDTGRGVIVAIPHSGNWDWAGAWVTAKGWQVTTVAERLKPEAVFDRFLDFRRRLGMHIEPHVGGERPVQTVLAEALGKGHVVPLVADRDLSSRGVEVDFFGEPTRMPAGPALLAIRTGAPIYTVVLYNDSDRTGRGELLGPVEVPADGSLAERITGTMQRIADRFAEGIARNPQDWHMLQRLWLADLPSRRD
ncbi:KDO2-lipid IV(A) lauroyltransferase [Stackebrandtia albiflava]|uniref:KDO2-lipid IV(A) lauroyltransferase n=1 Tax=Stackebrandtia albiflava TaxID=406432 RepID=A0A562VE61_9ACTN|nr:phosphatidylinositol mannoside acyltransferase [Stackebrandtia albiflava]TWJ16176.1 KDO2-lipid IV(A) lauroyltransferase [Stackebrandtia albiflava]